MYTKRTHDKHFFKKANVVHTTVTKTHRSELVMSDLPQDRIYGFVPNGQAKVSK